ncbi:hypothetical protein ACFYNL_38185 [Streptomyces sp. NPDC007808]|uniref:hypothetical protein n=1 Tax=Streptomyces sp. NPDC007808 TaxID=3364779 RepID=UPI0036C9EF78
MASRIQLPRVQESPTLKFAGGSVWTKIHGLAEPSAHDDDLRTATDQLMNATGLQRGRLTA